MQVETVTLKPIVTGYIPEPIANVDETVLDGIGQVVIVTDKELLVLGWPASEPDDISEWPKSKQDEWYEKAHNCDAMGCGWDHVLWRRPLDELSQEQTK